MAEDEMPHREHPPPAPGGGGSGLRPGLMFRWGVYVSLGVLAVLAAAAAVYTTRAVLVRVLIALFIAVSLDPAVRMLTRRGLRRGLAVLVIFLVAGGLVAAFLVSVIPAMIHQFQALVHDFPGYFASLQERSARLRGLSDHFHLTSKIHGFLASLPGKLGSGLLGYTRRLFGALASALTVAVLTVYFMTDLPRLRLGVRRLFPKAHRAVRPHRRCGGRQGRRLYDRQPADLTRGRAGVVRRLRRAWCALRGAAGVCGGGVRPDPHDRRDPGRGDLRAGRAAHHRAMA